MSENMCGIEIIAHFVVDVCRVLKFIITDFL